MQRPTARERSARQQDWWWIFDPSLSLRARVTLILGGSMVAFVLLLSSITGRSVQRTLEQQIAGGFETLAFQMSDKLDRVIYERYRELQLAAGLSPFRAREIAPAERRRLLEAIQGNAREFAWIGFADTRGQITAATRGVFEGTPVDQRGWFLLGRERSHAAGPHQLQSLSRALTQSDDEATRRYLDLALPVMAETGQFLGVLGAHLSWDWTRDVQNTVVPESLRRERIGVTVYGPTGEVLLDSGGSGWTQPPDAPAIADPRRFRGTLREPIGTGTHYITGFARSRGHREYRGLGWLIVVRQPADLAFAPARDMQRRIVAWGLFFAAIIVVLAWVMTGRHVRRLRGIAAAAERIREGDILTVMPRPSGGSEMARMCGSLADMVDDFRAKQDAVAPENVRTQEKAGAGGPKA